MSKLNKDVAAGLLFLAIGLTFLASGWNLPFGTWRKIGPGGFPAMVAGLLVLFGIGMALKGLVGKSEPLERLQSPRAVIAVLGALVIYGLLLQGAGLVVATLASTLVAACAVRPLRLLPMALYGVLMGVGCSLLFVTALGMQAPIIGPWFGF